MNYRTIITAAVQALGLFIVAFLIPVIGQLIALFTPVPLIIAYVRYGKTEGVAALILAAVIMGFLGGWHAGAVLFFSFGLLTIGVSEGMRRQWKPESAVLLGGLLPVIALAAVAGYFFYQQGKNPVIALEEYLTASIGDAVKVYTELGLAEMASAMQSLSAGFTHYLVRLIPGITITTSLFQAACCYGLSRVILLRKPGAAPALRAAPFAQWHAPDIWVWGLIAGLILVMLPADALRFTGWNIALIYTIVYLTQGVAIVDYFLRKARIQSFLRALIHTLILALPSIVFVIALGVVDIWADFRKVRQSAQAAP